MVAIDQLLYQSIFSFKATMIMSIFPMSHARMEHSQVTRSTSMGEDMIHQYVLACVESIQTILFLSSSWFTSHLKGSQG